MGAVSSTCTQMCQLLARSARYPQRILHVKPFVDAEIFCWNSLLIDEHLTYRRLTCLGHSVGSNKLSGVPKQQVFTYADTSVGLVREQNEALFLQLKQVISEIPVSGGDSCIATQ